MNSLHLVTASLFLKWNFQYLKWEKLSENSVKSAFHVGASSSSSLLYFFPNVNMTEHLFFFFSLDTSPHSEVNFVMDKLGGDTKRKQDLEQGNQPKISRRRHLLNNFFDIVAIAISIENI